MGVSVLSGVVISSPRCCEVVRIYVVPQRISVRPSLSFGNPSYIRSTSQHRGLEITTPDKTLTPNSYFINYRNGVASGFGIDPINDFVGAVRNRSPYPVTAVDGLAVSYRYYCCIICWGSSGYPRQFGNKCSNLYCYCSRWCRRFNEASSL